ncbi:hypothetical protein BCR42DRAFT_448242 [Absidia repens]|uniref:GDP-fucose protein O-fucosyltransferase-domain-containing protein n=1 Tax=Absidia repens TaxID=90262 RepID=A0A1X2IS94_9FUNG|nr:hypothetical protein BCR42DRAFT_448242 [Absidia repens]
MSIRSKSTLACFIVTLYLIYTSLHRIRRPNTIPLITTSSSSTTKSIPTPTSQSTIHNLPIPTSKYSFADPLITTLSTIQSEPIETPVDLPSLSPSPPSPPSLPSPTLERHPIDPNEKYLTFFTHSGFQNQLIQVENGILLAWYLNRTLILPKALLGEAFGWSVFNKLQLEHQLRDSDTTEECEEYIDAMDQWRIKCPDRDRYAMLPFDSIFDLSWAKQHVKILVREQANDGWLASTLGIVRAGGAGTNDPDLMVEEDIVEEQEEGSYVDGDILYFRGGTRYDWRIFDTPRKSQRLGKYADALNIYDLRKRKEKLIHFSSLFGSGKLPIRRPEHYDFLRSLQRSITYHHPAVLEMTDLIVDKLGGHGNFVGIHIRSGDGWFVNTLPENILSIVSQINRAVDSQHQRNTFVDFELDENSDSYDPAILPLDSSSMRSSTPPPKLEQCVTSAKNGDATLIYVATDARNPRQDDAFDPLWKLYPCSFTIHDILAQEGNGNGNETGDDDDDFGTEDNDDEGAAAAIASMGWSILDKERNPATGTSMRKFLLPLVDASVSSRGWFFIGSKGSTFSGYINRLHDVYWSDTKKQELASSLVDD